MTQVIEAIIDNTASLCESCGLTVNHVADGGFQCFTQGAHEVTFRAHLYATPTATLQQLIANISHWVTNGASVAISGLLLTVDSRCDIVIASFSEPECYGFFETSKPPPLMATETRTVSDSTTMLISRGPGTTSQQLATSQEMDKTSSLSLSAEAIIIGGVVVMVVFIFAAMVTVIIVACLCAKYCR
jgi:hypothetical protein